MTDDDLIRRGDAKAAAIKWFVGCPDRSGSALRAAIDALPAAGEGKWEKLYSWLSVWHGRMEKVAVNPDDSAHQEVDYMAHAVSLVLSEMEHLSTPKT